MSSLVRVAALVPVLASIWGAGCKGGHAEATVAAEAGPGASSAASSRTPDEMLALAPVTGTTTLDTLIFQYEEALKRNPKVETWVLLGRAWVRKARESADPGFYLSADACASVALRLSPAYTPALDLRALVLLNDHKFEEARALAQRVVDANPEDPVGYGSLGDALLELGKVDQAEAAIQTMVDKKPSLASYSRASYVDWLRGNVPDAIQIARLAIDAGNDPRDPEPRAWQLVQTAMIFWHQGDYAGADAGFDLAFDRGMADYPPALVGKARVALARGEGARAASLLERAYAQSPLTQTAWLLGDARSMAGDPDGARRAYALVEKEGKRSDGRTLSLYYSVKNLNPEAALALATAELRVRGDLYTDDALAWALHRSGRDAEARTAIDRALSHGTRDAMLLFHSGAIRIALHDTLAGRKLVAQALALNPGFDLTGAEEARRLLGGDGGTP